MNTIFWAYLCEPFSQHFSGCVPLGDFHFAPACFLEVTPLFNIAIKILMDTTVERLVSKTGWRFEQYGHLRMSLCDICDQ